MKMKKRTNKISIILIFFGILILFMPLINKCIFEVKSSIVIKKYEESIKTISKEELENQKLRDIKINQKIYDEDLFDASYIKDFEEIKEENNNILGIINIPKINIELPIYEGTSKDTLKKGIGHLENSSKLIGGITSHSVLAGHSGLASAIIFDNLNELNLGDLFFIKVQGDILEYEVIEKNIVLPNESNLKLEENRNLCTLVTCTPYRINTHRLLVTGELKEKNNLSEFNRENDKNIDNKKIEKFIVKQIVYLKYILFLIIVMCIIIQSF